MSVLLHACTILGGRELKTSVENLIFIHPHTSSWLTSPSVVLSENLIYPYIHPSILTQLKQCCLFTVSLPWFPLCFLPAVVWRTKRWWWVVFRESERERERGKIMEENICAYAILIYFHRLFNVISHGYTHILWSSIHIPRVAGKVERQLYTTTPFGVRCLAVASLIF